MMIKNYEKLRAKSYLRRAMLIVLVTQIFALVFFTSIGQLEEKQVESILQNEKGLVALSSTITLTILTIFVVYVLNKNFLIYYLGKFRERTYLYPGGRRRIFLYKLQSGISRYFVIFLICLIVINVSYSFVFNYLIANEGQLFTGNALIYTVNSALIFSITSIFILIWSMMCGIKLQSTNASLIFSICAVTLVGNVIAHSYTLTVGWLAIISIILISICYFSVRALLGAIEKDDIMNERGTLE